MAVGIIANPASGKDIRRLVSYATVIDNNEKVNIVKRAVCAAQAAGVKEIFMMPDSYQIGYAVKDALELEGKLRCRIELLDMPISAMARDTVIAAQKMEDMGVGCVIVLGGDGTSRAACKSLVNTPILPVSTGTNNVYPTMIEGTAAGLAAAAADLFPEVKSTFIKDKRIEVYDMSGRLLDIALVDAVISADIFIGTKAIWDMDKIRTVITALAHPAGIGFSTMVGCQMTVDPEDDFGMVVDVDKNKGQPVLVPVAAGTVQMASLTLPRKLHLEEPFLYQAEESCMIALDGEREVELKKGSSVIFKVTRQGPFRMDVRKTLEKARQGGMFSYAAAGR